MFRSCMALSNSFSMIENCQCRGRELVSDSIIDVHVAWTMHEAPCTHYVDDLLPYKPLCSYWACGQVFIIIAFNLHAGTHLIQSKQLAIANYILFIILPAGWFKAICLASSWLSPPVLLLTASTSICHVGGPCFFVSYFWLSHRSNTSSRPSKSLGWSSRIFRKSAICKFSDRPRL